MDGILKEMLSDKSILENKRHSCFIDYDREHHTKDRRTEASQHADNN